MEHKLEAIKVNQALKTNTRHRPKWIFYLILCCVLTLIGVVLLLGNNKLSINEVLIRAEKILSADSYYRETVLTISSPRHELVAPELNLLPEIYTQFLDTTAFELSLSLKGEVVKSQSGDDADLDWQLDYQNSRAAGQMVVKDAIVYLHTNIWPNDWNLPFTLLDKTIKLESNSSQYSQINDIALQVLTLESESVKSFYSNFLQSLVEKEILVYRDDYQVETSVGGEKRHNFTFNFTFTRLTALRDQLAQWLEQESNLNNRSTITAWLTILNNILDQDNLEGNIDVLNNGILSVVNNKKELAIIYQNNFRLAGVTTPFNIFWRQSWQDGVAEQKIVEPAGVITIDELLAGLAPQRLSAANVSADAYLCANGIELNLSLGGDGLQMILVVAEAKEAVVLNKIAENFYVSSLQDWSLNLYSDDPNKITLQNNKFSPMLCVKQQLDPVL